MTKVTYPDKREDMMRGFFKLGAGGGLDSQDERNIIPDSTTARLAEGEGNQLIEVKRHIGGRQSGQNAIMGPTQERENLLHIGQAKRSTFTNSKDR